MRSITKNEWLKLIEEMIERNNWKNYTGVFGVPRGGTLIATIISERTGIKLLDSTTEDCIVVDDLIDSGKTKDKYKYFKFDALIEKQDNEWINFWYEDEQKDAEDIVTRMIEYIGENPNREGLKDTPKRVVKMWKELFRGYDESQKPEITVFNNGEDGIYYDQMITDEGEFYSHCEHHLVIFRGQYYFSYIPDKKIIGLSKVARIVDYYSAKLQIQERLVKEIVDEIERVAQPKGIALVMKAEHFCKSMRGVKKKGTMTTTELRGAFKDNASTRAEFLNSIR
jgi:GTP cyclohydrolase IA